MKCMDTIYGRMYMNAIRKSLIITSVHIIERAIYANEKTFFSQGTS